MKTNSSTRSMKAAWLPGVLVAVGLVTLLCIPVSLPPETGDSAQAVALASDGTPQAARSAGAPAQVGASASAFSSYFQYKPVEVTYNAPQYALPLRSSGIANSDQLASLKLPPEATALLLRNGFAVTGFTLSPECDDFVEAYKALSAQGAPILVTSSSLLHTYQVLFDYTLSSIEARDLYSSIWTLGLGLFTKCYETYRNSTGDAKEAALRDAAYLAVGLSLLKPEAAGSGEGAGNVLEPSVPGGPRPMRGPGGHGPAGDQTREFTSDDLAKYKFEVPSDLAPQAGAELGLITKHAGFAPSPLFKYNEDYSQYVPRGHYTVSKKLQSYFKAMMWFGRMSMLLRGSTAIQAGAACSNCDALVSVYDARIQTLGACILASAMAGDKSLSDLWNKAYQVTSFFVGFSDDLGPYEYIEAIDKVFGGSFAPEAFSVKQGALKAKLAEYRAPRIYGGTGNCAIAPPLTPDNADSCLAKTRGFRLMGQRYVPDSYMMSKLVTPWVGNFTGTGTPFTCFEVPVAGRVRVLPRGLDVMALLGSDRAIPILADLGDSHYEGYDTAFAGLKRELEALRPEAWHQNLYWTWLWVLKAVLAQQGSGYPTFMQGDAWKDRLLAQALASWSELRHDTILYVKQSYTMMVTSVELPRERPQLNCYVEPVPEVYNRLLSLTRMMRQGLDGMGFLVGDEAARFTRLEDALGRLAAISAGELRGDAPPAEDLRFIGRFADVLSGVLGDIDAKSRKTTMAADVHTDANSGMVLEEALGQVDLLVALMKTGGQVYAAAGPDLSYFEFKQPMQDRLTDEAWREMLANRPPAPPGWTQAYSVWAK